MQQSNTPSARLSQAAVHFFSLGKWTEIFNTSEASPKRLHFRPLLDLFVIAMPFQTTHRFSNMRKNRFNEFFMTFAKHLRSQNIFRWTSISVDFWLQKYTPKKKKLGNTNYFSSLISPIGVELYLVG